MNIKRKNIFFLSLAFVSVILTGCGNDAVEQAEPTEPIDNETVVSSTPAQKAFAYCSSKGFAPTLEHKEATGFKLFCDFSEERRCEAVQYLAEDCSIETAEIITPLENETATKDDIFEGPRFCDPIAKPVCGSNGKTYANSCIATQFGITQTTEGTCLAANEPGDPELLVQPASRGSLGNRVTTNNTNNSNGTPVPNVLTSPTVPSNNTQSPNGSIIPEWAPLAFSFAEQNPNTTYAIMYKCTAQNANYFLQVEECPTCFSTLYAQDGTLICNPSNDLNSACPSAFADGKKPSTCREILKK